jgi:adenosylmethionine-8-amino-7-oxononanoate aminotransferase
LQKLHWVNRQYDTLLIFDEVMTGFGRTGDWFACAKAQVEPDIICLAKGLTGGFLPLSVTVSSDEIYEAFNSEEPIKTFWHGHSYTANPLGCAAALASLKLLDTNQAAFKMMEQWHHLFIKQYLSDTQIDRIRVKGTIAAFRIVTNEESGYLNRVADTVKKVCIDYGLLLRPLGDTLYLMPPYCITKEELENVYQNIQKLLIDHLDQAR